MNFYIIRMINNVLGHKVLETITEVNISDSQSDADKVLYIKATRGAEAEGKQTSEGFVVFKNSRIASSTTKSCPKFIIELRKKLMDSGTINSEGVFTESKVFSSPSTAAAIVMGRSANGLTEWRNK